MNKRIIGSRALSGVLEWVLRVMFYAGILIDLTLPFTLRHALPFFYRGPITDGFYAQAFSFVMAFGVLMVSFVFFAARVFKTINNGDPFIDENLKSLLAMALISLGLSCACGYYAARGQSILALILTLFFLFFCAFLLVLRELFRSAVAFKEENDFTI